MGRMSKAQIVLAAVVVGLGLAALTFPTREREVAQPAASQESANNAELTTSPSVNSITLHDAPSDPEWHSNHEGAARVGAMPYSSNFERIFENQHPDKDYRDAIRRLEQIENEPRDPQWAEMVESHFRAHWISSAELARFGMPTVECRTTRCQLRLTADRAAPGVDWHQVPLFPDHLEPDPNIDAVLGKKLQVAQTRDEHNGYSVIVVDITYCRPPGRSLAQCRAALGLPERQPSIR